MATAPLHGPDGAAAGELELPASVFDQPLRADLVHQAVNTELWNRRQGTASTRTRSEVSGGGRKPFRQKGTGRARQGSTRAPHWRHGGVVHGPRPRDYHKSMPQKMRRAAFRSALSAKARSGAVRVIEELTWSEISTRKLVEFLGQFEGGRKKTLVVAERNEPLALSCRNVPDVRLVVLPGLSTRTVVDSDTLILTRAAVQKIEETYGG